MPRDGRGIWSPPPGTRAVPNAIIESEKYNAFVDDIQADLNGARPVTAGGTGATNGADARTILGAASAEDLKATNANLTTAKDNIAEDIKSTKADLMRVNDDLAKKLDLAGGTMTGPLTVKEQVAINGVDGSVRRLFNQDGTIGVTGGDGKWSTRFHDTGEIWTKLYGNLSGYFATKTELSAKLNLSGGTMTGDLEIQKTQPSLMIHYQGVSWWKAQVANNSNLYFTNHMSGDSFMFGQGGDIWTRQFGDLNTRIETRAREWADDRAQRITARLAFAGDLFDYESGQGTAEIREPFGGAVVTGFAGARGQGVTRLRFRYLQMKNIFDQWYTVGWF